LSALVSVPLDRPEWAQNGASLTICVTGEKHPDGCKNVAADGHVVVSDDAMEWLNGKTGEAATIEAVGAKAASTPSGQAHRHHRQDAPQ